MVLYIVGEEEIRDLGGWAGSTSEMANIIRGFDGPLHEFVRFLEAVLQVIHLLRLSLICGMVVYLCIVLGAGDCFQ